MDLFSESQGIVDFDIEIDQYQMLHQRMYRIFRILSLPVNHSSVSKARHFSIITANMVVQRITMFKVNEEADIQKMIDQYKVVAETNNKVCF